MSWERSKTNKYTLIDDIKGAVYNDSTLKIESEYLLVHVTIDRYYKTLSIASLKHDLQFSIPLEPIIEAVKILED